MPCARPFLLRPASWLHGTSTTDIHRSSQEQRAGQERLSLLARTHAKRTQPPSRRETETVQPSTKPGLTLFEAAYPYVRPSAPCFLARRAANIAKRRTLGPSRNDNAHRDLCLSVHSLRTMHEYILLPVDASEKHVHYTTQCTTHGLTRPYVVKSWAAHLVSPFDGWASSTLGRIPRCRLSPGLYPIVIFCYRSRRLVRHNPRQERDGRMRWNNNTLADRFLV